MDSDANIGLNIGVSRAQATTNIFLNAYQNPENKLTYNFLALLEHIQSASAVGLLAQTGLRRTVPVDELEVSLLQGGLKGNPDGRIDLKHDGVAVKVFFENKTWRRQLDLDQIRRQGLCHCFR